MIKKFASIVLAAVLVFTLAGTSAFADNSPKSDATTQPDGATEASKVVNEKLRVEILKLVDDTKAGRSAMRSPQTQIPRPQRNNLSQGTKIAIGVGIAAAVVAVILVSKRCSNEPGGC